MFLWFPSTYSGQVYPNSGGHLAKLLEGSPFFETKSFHNTNFLAPLLTYATSPTMHGRYFDTRDEPDLSQSPVVLISLSSIVQEAQWLMLTCQTGIVVACLCPSFCLSVRNFTLCAR